MIPPADTATRASGWSRFGTRAGVAGLGAVGGALIGVGFAALYCIPAECDGDTAVAVSSGLGAILGTAAGAALPRLRSPCSFTRRLVLASVGSAAGTALGAAAAPDDTWVIIPVSTIAGASLATLAC